MENENIKNKLMETLMKLKKTRHTGVILSDSLTKNEQIVLFIIYDLSEDKKISLSSIRDRINLAPSTITPIISSLEKKGLVRRYIDRSDRRNIYLKLSQKGTDYTEKIYNDINSIMQEYIEYISIEDAEKLTKILNKTIEFIEKKKGEKDVKNI